jgi:acyl-CoA thioester hydrolase
MKPRAPDRTAYRAFLPITTRWMDNDLYGHVNNVVYYSFFDTAVNQWLIERGLLDLSAGETIGFVVRTECDYFAPIAFPQRVEAGLGVEHLGRSSVRYRVGIFADGGERAVAGGRFTHVYVDRATRRPRPLSERWLRALGDLVVGNP